MSVDRLSNMLSALKNASMAGRREIEIYHSKECENVAKVLKEAGYLSEVKTFKLKDSSFKKLNLEIAVDEDSTSMITDVERLSKLGRRFYVTHSEISKQKSTRGVTVVSTSRGVMSSVEARKRKLGGEALCRVY